MKQFLFLVKFYLTFLLLFVLAKPCFVLAQSAEVRGDITWLDVIQSVWHGLTLDIATTGYVSALVWLLTGVITFWTKLPKVKSIYKVYAACIAFIFSLIVVADTCLYDFWRFKIDGTVFNYLDEPQGMFESVSALYAITVIVVISLLTYGIYRLLASLYPDNLLPIKHRVFWAILWVMTGGSIFVGIRGGFDKSTTNVGQVLVEEILS